MFKVLVVDDSAVVRRVLTEQLSKYSDIEVVGTAMDPYVARDKIVKVSPDVLTLDIEMPRMDGLSFLARLMKHHPMPVVIVSSLAPENSVNAIRALELGAVDIVRKPGSTFSAPDVDRQLIHSIRAAAKASVATKRMISDTPARPADAGQLMTTHKVLAVGASTGGTQAIEYFLRGLPTTCPGTVIVQHMPPVFTAAFAARMNSVCPMEVREAVDGESVVPGLALIAPGDKHMVLQRSGARYFVKIKDGPHVHFQRPSVDVLFHSVAQTAGTNALGVILTGMGADGAKGLLAMRQSGARTFAQDEHSCVVFGMPREAIVLGGAEQVVPLGDMARHVLTGLAADAA